MGNVSVELGGLELSILDAGEFFIDGGAMFGAVPKVIWENLLPVDDLNRIPLTLSPLLISTPSQKILVDVGFGSRRVDRDIRVYGFDPGRNVETALADEGLSRDDIDVVILTHLHSDHAGGATSDGERGVEPAFPAARYIVNEHEWHDATDPDPRSAAGYREDDFVPLEAAGQLTLVPDRHDVGDGVSTIRTGGHTTGHLMVLVETDGGTAVYPADLVPSRHHVRVPYVAALDLYPMDVIDEKEKLLNKAADGEWLFILDHDREGNIGRVERGAKGRFVFHDVSV